MRRVVDPDARRINRLRDYTLSPAQAAALRALCKRALRQDLDDARRLNISSALRTLSDEE